MARSALIAGLTADRSQGYGGLDSGVSPLRLGCYARDGAALRGPWASRLKRRVAT